MAGVWSFIGGFGVWDYTGFGIVLSVIFCRSRRRGSNYTGPKCFASKTGFGVVFDCRVLGHLGKQRETLRERQTEKERERER